MYRTACFKILIIKLKREEYVAPTLRVALLQRSLFLSSNIPGRFQHLDITSHFSSTLVLFLYALPRLILSFSYLCCDYSLLQPPVIGPQVHKNTLYVKLHYCVHLVQLFLVLQCNFTAAPKDFAFLPTDYGVGYISLFLTVCA